jgi:transcriptional regulator with XRE-family HTH domain
MKVDKQALIQALKDKREAEGLSVRALSKKIGVSFSSLARILRDEGEPDNNSTIRILAWLEADAANAGLRMDGVALVHFRAAKNVSSKTVECLLKAANSMRVGDKFDPQNSDLGLAVSLSKPEMEEMANEFRSDLSVNPGDPLDALNVRISGVEVFAASQAEFLDEACAQYLLGPALNEWSAMSVPRDVTDDTWAILRNDGHSIERQRVTYLEECWHILLGHKLTRIAKVGDAYGRTYDSSEEHDAYFLASACLLPETDVRELVKAGRSAKDIAAQFGTSMELAEYRIKRLGLWRAYQNRSIDLQG